MKLLVLVVGFILSQNAYCSAVPGEFFGAKLGATEAEFTKVMKARGIVDIYDKEKQLLNGRPFSIEKYMKKTESDRNRSFCMSHVTTPMRTWNCVFPLVQKKALFQLSSSFYQDKLFKIVSIFNPDLSEDAMKGILGKFGPPTDSTEKIHFPEPNNPLPSQVCSVPGSCRTAKWSDSIRRQEVIYLGPSLFGGKAVSLDLMDIATYELVGTKLVDEYQNQSEKQAKELDF